MELMILDKDFNAIPPIVDTYESLIWTERYSSLGDFELFTSVDETLLSTLQINYILWNKDSKKCMFVEDREIDTDVEIGPKLRVTGRSLESILNRRIIWNATTLTGSLQLAVKKLIDENIISPTIANRKIDNFRFKLSEDPAILDLTIEEYFFGENLYDVVEVICLVYGLGFRVTLMDDNWFEFELYSGVDRSYDQDVNPPVIFSPRFENLINSNYVESNKMLRTTAFVYSDSSTAVVEKEEVSGLGRREMFVDAGYVESSDQLPQKGEEELAQNTIFKSFEGEIETQQLYRYGEDFDIGDIVQITNEYGLESKVRITEIVRSKSLSETSVIPTLTTVY